MRTILSFFNRNHIVFQNLVSTECFIPKTTSAISPIINIINGTAISQKLKNALRDELQTILIKGNLYGILLSIECICIRFIYIYLYIYIYIL